MIITSTRLGEFEVQDSDIITFTEGFPGLPEWQSGVLVPVPEVPLLCWLQFIHDPDAAFLLLDVKEFVSDYDVALAKMAAGLGEDCLVMTIVKVPGGDFSRSTTNLLAPVVIQPPRARSEELGALRLGKQVILHETNYPLRQPLFGRVE